MDRHLVYWVAHEIAVSEFKAAENWEYESEPVLLARAYDQLRRRGFSWKGYWVEFDNLVVHGTRCERRFGADLVFSYSYRSTRRGVSYTKYFVAQAKRCECRLGNLMATFCCPNMAFQLSNGNRTNLDDKVRNQLIKMMKTSSSSYLLLITDGCGFLYVPASTAVSLPWSLSCKRLGGYAVSSVFFYTLFLSCFTGEVLWGVFMPDARSVVDRLMDRVSARQYFHVSVSEEG